MGIEDVLGECDGKPCQRESRQNNFIKQLDQHQTVLVRVVRRLCAGDHDHSEDIIQETVLKGYCAYMEGHLDKDAGFRPWILKIALNTFYHHARSKKHVFQPLTDDLQAAQRECPEQVVINGIFDVPLEDAMRSLPSDQRLAVELVDVAELSYIEAAQAMDVPIGTVRSRLARARLALGLYLVQHGYESPK